MTGTPEDDIHSRLVRYAGGPGGVCLSTTQELDASAYIKRLEADKAALVEALKQCHAELMSIHLRHGDRTHAILLSAGLSLVDALPAHLKEAAKEEAR